MGFSCHYIFCIKKTSVRLFFEEIGVNYTDGICKHILTDKAHSFELVDVKKMKNEDWLYGGSFSLSLYFEQDDDIISYLRQRHRENETKANGCYIGLIDVYITQNASLPDVVNVRFSPVSSDMSLLFTISSSVQRTFITICEKQQPLLLFLSGGSITVLWYNGKEHFKWLNDLEVSEEEFLQLFFLQNELKEELE